MARKSMKRKIQESLDSRPTKKAKKTQTSTSFQHIPAASQASVALQLPPELLLEILSYFKSLPVPIDTRARMLHEDYLERTDMLRALSQTCKVWRQMFLPLLWSSLNIVSSHSKSAAWYKTLSESLIRKSELVREMPELASYVRCMSLCLSRYAMPLVLSALVSMLERLPNLETLQIVRVHPHMITPLKNAFEGRVFPQIQVIYLPTAAHHLLRSCPNVVNVTCNSQDDGSTIVGALKKYCKKVEEVKGIYESGNILKRLTKAAPQLRTVEINLSASNVEPLKKFKHLQNVVFVFANVTAEDQQKGLDSRFKPFIQIARDALKGSTSAILSRKLQCKGKGWVMDIDLTTLN
ncbi:hypothetical protein CVT24_013005 [Panaeolus cyanescens]|uniref:F-box domain-containing protein n=1 Tax=Panaeolus cyanescens TaxID=181874 RepID=A0A409VVP9_9AGAR|nr:hypothetical protein CVT24_013005 [Panaeolus cyanescens]